MTENNGSFREKGAQHLWRQCYHQWKAISKSLPSLRAGIRVACQQLSGHLTLLGSQMGFTAGSEEMSPFTGQWVIRAQLTEVLRQERCPEGQEEIHAWQEGWQGKRRTEEQAQCGTPAEDAHLWTSNGKDVPFGPVGAGTWDTSALFVPYCQWEFSSTVTEAGFSLTLISAHTPQKCRAFKHCKPEHCSTQVFSWPNLLGSKERLLREVRRVPGKSRQQAESRCRSSCHFIQ